MDESIEAITAPFLASDLAMEVRNVYYEHTGVGIEAGPATHGVFQRFIDLIDDPNEGPVIMFALTAIQLQQGTLLDPIRTAALTLIEDGSATRAWRQTEYRSIKQRAAALAALAELLHQ